MAALGLISQVAEAIQNGPEGMARAKMSMRAIDPINPNNVHEMLGEGVFQYWPETIEDGIAIGWQEKEVPGGSSALMNWTGNGGRTLTFSVELHRFMSPADADTRGPVAWRTGSNLVKPTNQNLKDERPHNVDVKGQIAWLRGHCYPTYARLTNGQQETTVSFPPPFVILNMPNTGIGEGGEDYVFAVMTGCEVTYQLLFPNGTPRRATVSLTFKVVAQTPDGIRFKGWGTGYKITNDEKMRSYYRNYAV